MTDNIENTNTNIQEEQNKQESKFVTCPCCGKDTMKVPADIDQSIKQGFLASLLTGTQYTHTYNMYNGLLSITVREASNSIKDKLIHIANKGMSLQNKEQSRLLNIIMTRIFKLSSIDIICVYDSVNENNTKIFQIGSFVQTILDRLDKYKDIQDLNIILDDINNPSNISSVPGVIIDKILEAHARQMNVLIQSGFDDSFSEGIVHVL